MRNRKTWIIGGLILAVVIAAAVMGGRQQVEVVQATRGALTLQVEETGYVQAVNDREIQASQPARVVELLVSAGDRVATGEVLIKLTSPELAVETASVRSQLAQVQAQLEASGVGMDSLQAERSQAQSSLSKKKTLLASGAVSRLDYDQAELEYRQLEKKILQQQANIAGLEKQSHSLQAMLDSLEDQSSELDVASPIKGVVLDLPVKSGQFVAPGTLLAQVGSDQGMEIRTELLSDEVRRVKTGQKAVISAPVLGDRTLPGRVDKIHPRAFEKVSALGVIQRRVPVIVSLEESGSLRPGYEVRVAIETLHKEGVLILPREAVRVNKEGDYRVWAVVDGRIKECPVKIGEKNQQRVEIREGVGEGQPVIRDASQEIKPGTRVKPVAAD